MRVATVEFYSPITATAPTITTKVGRVSFSSNYDGCDFRASVEPMLLGALVTAVPLVVRLWRTFDFNIGHCPDLREKVRRVAMQCLLSIPNGAYSSSE
jgi:hypothetical protein